MRLGADGTPEPFETQEPLSPTGITFDPISGNLLVVDALKHRLVAVDIASGAVANMLEGLSCDYWGGAGIDTTPDGKQLFYTEFDTGMIVTFARRTEPSCFDRGLTHAQISETQEAVLAFTEMIQQDPEHALSFSERGFAYATLGKLDEAQSDWGTAIAIDPAVALHYHFRGEVLRYEGQWQKAGEEYSRAIRLDPELTRAYAGRASVALAKSEGEKALSDLTRAIELDPDNDFYYAERGFACEMQGEAGEAKRDWAKARQLNDQCDLHYITQGEMFQEHQQWESATEAFGKSLHMNPSRQLSYLRRATVWMLCEKWSEAEQDLLSAIEVKPAEASIWFRLGVVRLAAGNPEAYRDGCRELIRRHASGNQPLIAPWEVAWCCKLAPLEQEEMQRVVQLARDSLVKFPSKHRIQFELACVLYRAGRYQESWNLLQQLWDKNAVLPPLAEIQTALTLLALGKTAEATKYLALDEERNKLRDLVVFQVIALRLLRREAASLMSVSQRPVPREGEDLADRRATRPD